MNASYIYLMFNTQDFRRYCRVSLDRAQYVEHRIEQSLSSVMHNADTQDYSFILIYRYIH